jgi:type III pantothenate kinase
VLLAIDVGNTETLIGLFRDAELASHWRIATEPERTADELGLLVTGLLDQEDVDFRDDVTGVAVSSVVPAITHALKEMNRRYSHVEPLVIEPGVKTGLSVLTDNPREVGADRIVNAVAAFARFGGPCVVVDFGTATTYDAISEAGELLGTAIAPGILVSAESLFTHAARLPSVEIAEPRSVIGKNTVEAIQSGLLWGTVGETEGMINRMKKELGDEAQVVATGGLAAAIVPFTDAIDHHEPWLTLEGLRMIFDRNAGE